MIPNLNKPMLFIINLRVDEVCKMKEPNEPKSTGNPAVSCAFLHDNITYNLPLGLSKPLRTSLDRSYKQHVLLASNVTTENIQ